MSAIASGAAAVSQGTSGGQSGQAAPASGGSESTGAGNSPVRAAAASWLASRQQDGQPPAPVESAAPAEPAQPAATEAYDDDEHQSAFEEPAQEGEAQPAAEEDNSAAALAAVEAMFGLKPGQATPNLMSGMMSDVEAYRATLGGKSQPAAASPQAEPVNQARPPAPDSAPATPPAPVPQPQAAKDPGSDGDLAPLTDEQISAMAEYDPALGAVGQAVNRLISKFSAQQASPVIAELQQQVQAMQAEHVWTQVQPVVQSFVDAAVKQGLPALPPEQLREFAEEASGYLDWKTKAGHKVTPQQAMQAIYLARTGTQLQAKAAAAHAEGRQSVIKGLEKRQRQFVLSGQPGAVAPSQKAPDPKTSIKQLASRYRAGQAQS